MSEKNTSVLRTFTDEPKKHSCYPILATHLAAKDDSRRGSIGASFSTPAERLLSEQSVPLLGEANSQTRKELL